MGQISVQIIYTPDNGEPITIAQALTPQAFLAVREAVVLVHTEQLTTIKDSDPVLAEILRLECFKASTVLRITAERRLKAVRP